VAVALVHCRVRREEVEVLLAVNIPHLGVLALGKNNRKGVVVVGTVSILERHERALLLGEVGTLSSVVASHATRNSRRRDLAGGSRDRTSDAGSEHSFLSLGSLLCLDAGSSGQRPRPKKTGLRLCWGSAVGHYLVLGFSPRGHVGDFSGTGTPTFLEAPPRFPSRQNPREKIFLFIF
jgi:hypothetical protein